MTQTLEKLRTNILEERKENEKLTWRDIASRYDVNVAVIWRIVNEGYEPKNNEIRKRLGLSITVMQYKDPITGRFMEKSK